MRTEKKSVIKKTLSDLIHFRINILSGCCYSMNPERSKSFSMKDFRPCYILTSNIKRMEINFSPFPNPLFGLFL